METKQQISYLPPSFITEVNNAKDIFDLDGFEQSFDTTQLTGVNYLEFIPAEELPSLDTGIRFNVGGQKYTDVFGRVWQKDKYFSDRSHQFSQDIEIGETDLDPIYQTERFSKNLDYSIPLENNTYDIKLHFAEIYFAGENRRVFDVSVEENLISNDLDLAAQVGKGEALAIAINDIQVEDGILNLNLDSSVDNAKLSGIEIVPSAENKAIRINAGGDGYLDGQGKIWQADSYFDSSNNTFSRPIAIENTGDDYLFQTEHFGQNFNYDVPVDNGAYDINLHFAEIFFDSEEKRIFDVEVESQLVKNDLDLVAEVGAATSFVLELNDIFVSDGTLDLDLIANVNNAKISAIEIIPVEHNQAPIIELDTAELAENGAVINRLTDFAGNIIDDDLESYRVEIAPVSLLDLNNLTEADPDYVPLITENHSVAEDTLFTIDPSLFEKGTYYARVYARDSSGNISFEGLFLEIEDPAGIYVSASGTSKGSGTKDDPVATLKDACKILEGGSTLDTIYVREGVYTNPGYGDGVDNKSMGAITCSGTSDEYLTIRPYGEEKVKFAFDSFNGIRLKGNYINFQGFEIEGAAQDITYEEAIADWWIGSKKHNGNGIVINGHHINVRDNIVHDTTGSAIFINDGGDHSNITDNIIYNAAWWSTKGTTAIGMISAKSSDDTIDQTIKAERNLIFASESRIFSRVPSKGFAELAIDEGSGTLVQVNNGKYKGEYLIKDNFYLYNGKGVAIARTDNVTVENNTLYMNGSTINGKSTGLRLNEGKDISFLNNAVVVDPEDNAYSVARENEDSFVSSQDNYFVSGDVAKELPSGNNLVSQIFTDADSLDFSLLEDIPVNVGAPLSVFNNLKTKADEYDIKIAPSNWVMDYEQQTKDIIELAPTGSTFDWSEWPEKVIVHLPEGQEFEGNAEFELRIKTPYARED